MLTFSLCSRAACTRWRGTGKRMRRVGDVCLCQGTVLLYSSGCCMETKGPLERAFSSELTMGSVGVDARSQLWGGEAGAGQSRRSSRARRPLCYPRLSPPPRILNQACTPQVPIKREHDALKRSPRYLFPPLSPLPRRRGIHLGQRPRLPPNPSPSPPSLHPSDVRSRHQHT